MSDDGWNPTDGDQNQGKTQTPPPPAADDNVVSMEAFKAMMERTARLISDTEREKARAKAEAERAKGDKPPTFISMYRELTALMTGEATAILPSPPERLIVASDDGGKTRRALVVGPREVCWEADPEAVAGVFSRYCHSPAVAQRYPWYATFEPRHSDAAAKFWRRNAPTVASPVPFRFASDAGRCFHRAAFDPAAAPTPLCDELFSRMTNALAVKAWIGSLFDPAASRQQYVWLHGLGGDGKGSLARLLAWIFGPGAASLSTPPLRDKHWAWHYADKRLVIFSDLVDTRAMRGAELRIVVGGDAVTVDPKGGKPFTTALSCMVLICTNGMPYLENIRADLRRIIFAELTGRPTDDDGNARGAADYELRLRDEAPGLVAECLRLYAERASCGEITLSAEERRKIGEWAGISDDSYQAFFDEHFVIDEQAGVVANDAARRLDARDGRRHGAFSQAWYAWLRRQPGDLATSHVAKPVGRRSVRVFYGWRLRQPLVDDTRDVVMPERVRQARGSVETTEPGAL